MEPFLVALTVIHTRRKSAGTTTKYHEQVLSSDGFEAF